MRRTIEGTLKLALGLSYRGTAYVGWQRQTQAASVQSCVEAAIGAFVGPDGLETSRNFTVCAGRTDAGVHARVQVVHFECGVHRAPFSWVRGVNAHLPADIRVQWALPVEPSFDARRSARRRRYAYRLYLSPVAPAIAHGLAGWTFERVDVDAMREAAQHWIGEHDFSSFRSSECQAKSPIRQMYAIDIQTFGPWMVVHFEANAFLHHMVRNLMGALLAVGAGRKPSSWAREVLEIRDRRQGAPTFMPDGLYLAGIHYPEHEAIDRLSWAARDETLLP